jgi:uncharacterized protein YbaP (TraB family)
MYLTGSFHVATPDFYPLSPAIVSAFAEADNLIVEMDVTALTPQESLNIFSEGFNPKTITLSSQLTPETLRVLSEVELPESLFVFLETLRPWMAAITIEALSLTKLGFLDTYGLDTYFIKAAKTRALPISELESPQEQVKLFTDMSDLEQDLYLRSTLLELKEPIHPIEKYKAFWQAGDHESFYASMKDAEFKNPELAVVFDRIIYQRNKSLTDRLLPFFHRPGRVYFSLVGAAHLVGPLGIPTLFREAGFKVTQL